MRPSIRTLIPARSGGPIWTCQQAVRFGQARLLPIPYTEFPG